MAHKNQKIEKEKEYNPFKTRTIKRETVGNIKCYLKAVKQNPKDVHGVNKTPAAYYTGEGYMCLFPNGRMYNPEEVFFYEVCANDGSYRKCTTREDAEKRFAQLVESSRKDKLKSIKR